MTIMLNFWGAETSQQEAASYLKPNEEDRNVSPWQISQYINDFTTLRSTVHASGTPEVLKRFIAAGFPVVIEKGYEPGTSEGWYGHYLTVYGYDETKQEFYSRDTYLGPFDGSPRIDGYDEFMKWWQQFYYTFYVIYPLSREAEVMAIVPDVLEYDPEVPETELQMWQHTADIARQELANDRENVFTWFNLGVALTRMAQITGSNQQYSEAIQAFDQAREIGLPPRALYYEHRPLMAHFKLGQYEELLELTNFLIDETSGGEWVEEIHWYRGHALAGLGDFAAAQEAYMEALEVNPNFSPAQVSLDWVNGQLGE
jgi:tetratricopeptide (TPR) repeat protein